jgi:hypothetical protein
MKYYRGDTLPVVISYEGYTFKAGDVVTAGIIRERDDGELEKLKEVSVTVTGECDAVQLEFSREDMYDIDGKVILEGRTVTAGDVEMTVQKTLNLGKDGLR